jgi:metallo-beta-lactamase class B
MVKQLANNIIRFTLLLGIVGLYPANAGTIDKIVVDKDIQLIRLQDSIFVHMTFHTSANIDRFPSNGLVVIKNGQAIMVDTPMDNDKTERLVRYLEDSLHVVLTKLIIGHFHDDCLGGLEYLQIKGIESIANHMTVEKCRELGLPVPSTPFKDSLTVDLQGEQIECRYLGGGHTFDNITVWIPSKKILFGGCLVRSSRSNNLGNLTDAVVDQWDVTIKKLMAQYPDVETVIPGHGDFGSEELLTHTLELVEREKNK